MSLLCCATKARKMNSAVAGGSQNGDEEEPRLAQAEGTEWKGELDAPRRAASS